MKKLHAWLVFGSLLLSSCCWADWNGSLEVQGVGAEQGQSQGKIYAKGSKLRFEMQARGNEMIILMDAKGQTGSMLMPAQKMAMDMPASMADKKMIACSTDNIEGCLKGKGYKKTGTDTVDGHPCDVYEGDEVHGEMKTHQKLWRPTDLKEVFMVKSLGTTSDGKQVITLVKNIKMGKLQDALFKVPADYKKMKMPSFGATH